MEDEYFAIQDFVSKELGDLLREELIAINTKKKLPRGQSKLPEP